MARSAVALTLSVVLGILSNANAAGKGVYGIDSQLDLVQYNVNSGQTTHIADGPGSGYITGESLACFDNAHKILYVLVTGGQITDLKTGLFGFNLSDPSNSVGFVELPQIYASNYGGAGEQCVGDPNTGDVFVFGHSSQNLTQQLLLRVSIDSSNKVNIATVSEYADIDDLLLLPGEMSIFDSKRNKMWIAGEYNSSTYYYYIDAETGSIDNDISYDKFPIFSSGYDATLDQLVGVSFDGFEPDNNAQYVMKYADPVTLSVTKTLTAFKEWCFWVAEGSIDEENQIWYQLLTNATSTDCRDSGNNLVYYLVGVDIKSGEIQTAAPISNTWDLFYWNGQ